jgi:hypothetical protein
MPDLQRIAFAISQTLMLSLLSFPLFLAAVQAKEPSFRLGICDRCLAGDTPQLAIVSSPRIMRQM